jgi:hypothetical protein
MTSYRAQKILKAIVFVLVAAAALGFLVKGLWNALMPGLFGLHALTFWQALGLLLLTKLFFGGFRPRPGGPAPWKRRFRERWEQMSPEEREQFRQGIRCGRRPFGRPVEP